MNVMEFLVILFGALFVYYLGIVVYHLISKVVYVKEAYVRSFFRNMLFGCVMASIGILAGVFAFNTHYSSPTMGKWVLLVFPFGILILALIAIDAAVKKRNWKKYTLAKFAGGALYDFEAQYKADNFIFGRIYWDRKKNEQCFCQAYLEVGPEHLLVKGKNYKVKFSSDYCQPKVNDLGCNLVVEA